MANYQDITPIRGQNFNTADQALAKGRAQLHATRRERGRLQMLPKSDRIDRMIERLWERELVLAETFEKD